MHNQGQLPDGAMEVKSSACDINNWGDCRDDDIMQQKASIGAESEAVPYIGDKESLSSLAAEYQSGSPIILEKIKTLSNQFGSLRRTRGDGNCFFRGFMFSYLEHILETQDKKEVERIRKIIEECRNTLQKLGYKELTFEDFFEIFIEQIESVIQGKDTSISHAELVNRCRDQSISDYIVMFFRLVTSSEIKRRADFFEPFILGFPNTTVDQFCKTSVEPMGEESDHVHITALSDALGVPIRIVYLDRSSCDAGSTSVNHHDFVPASTTIPSATIGASDSEVLCVTLLYRPGHYDILYHI